MIPGLPVQLLGGCKNHCVMVGRIISPVSGNLNMERHPYTVP
jgi:hypothetical protein